MRRALRGPERVSRFPTEAGCVLAADELLFSNAKVDVFKECFKGIMFVLPQGLGLLWLAP
jgi:hypothetical protein